MVVCKTGTYKEYPLTLAHLRVLESPTGWLNGEIINSFVAVLNIHFTNCGVLAHAFHTFHCFEIFPPSHDKNPRHSALLKVGKKDLVRHIMGSASFSEKCSRIIKKLKSFDRNRYFVFALNVHSAHWVFILADRNKQALYEIDSLTEGSLTTPRYLTAVIEAFLNSVLTGLNMDKWTLTSVRAPQQENKYDSGLYVILLITVLVHCEFDLSFFSKVAVKPEQVQNFRKAASLIFRYASTHDNNFVLLSDKRFYNLYVSESSVLGYSR
eukprot:Nk52_evm20s279 gene=Nk52_evmTU20s279